MNTECKIFIGMAQGIHKGFFYRWMHWIILNYEYNFIHHNKEKGGGGGGFWSSNENVNTSRFQPPLDIFQWGGGGVLQRIFQLQENPHFFQFAL